MHVHCGAITRCLTVLLVTAGIACGVPAALLLVACGDGDEPPSGPPDQAGHILAVTLGTGDILGTLLVGPVESMSEEIVGDASVSVTSDTVWMRDGKVVPAPPLDLDLLGQRAEVKFTGPVAESFPVQATAALIRLLPTASDTVHGRTMWAGGPAGTVQPEANERVAIRWGDEGGPVVKVLMSGPDGRFDVELKPGEYTFVTRPDDDKTPAARQIRLDGGRQAVVRLVESVR